MVAHVSMVKASHDTGLPKSSVSVAPVLSPVIVMLPSGGNTCTSAFWQRSLYGVPPRGEKTGAPEGPECCAAAIVSGPQGAWAMMKEVADSSPKQTMVRVMR